MPLALKLKHVEFVEVQFQALPPSSVGKGNRNASTTKRGEQTGNPTAADAQRKASVAYQAIFGRG
jgi:hypothetical protein